MPYFSCPVLNERERHTDLYLAHRSSTSSRCPHIHTYIHISSTCCRCSVANLVFEKFSYKAERNSSRTLTDKASIAGADDVTEQTKMEGAVTEALTVCVQQVLLAGTATVRACQRGRRVGPALDDLRSITYGRCEQQPTTVFHIRNEHHRVSRYYDGGTY